MRVQDIAKGLTKAGLKKMSWNTKENCIKGDYEIREFNYNGIHSYVSVNHGVFNKEQRGVTIDKVVVILNDLGLNTKEVKGIIQILK
tara:strand:+ start:309 stop:569 length:261 start_codon:yes stop_codon:yes gene_type:complete